VNAFTFQMQTRLVFGAGAFERLGELARELGFSKTLLVIDRDLTRVGYANHATRLLNDAGIEVFTFSDFTADPDSAIIELGRAFAAPFSVDSIVGLGGGSSLDCAKGINFLLTNGGQIQDYLGYGKTTKPLLPMIGVPTTAGTGSEVQSYAVISDAGSHRKMACGDPGAAFRLAILDPQLTLSQPHAVTAASGFDAIAHAVETYVSTSRTPASEMFSREAWRLLSSNYERVLADPNNLPAREAMQLGASLAGIAIENSMLGATHACANPLTAHYGTTHGVALAMLLPSVVRWNSSTCADRYLELLRISGRGVAENGNTGDDLAVRLEQLAEVAGLRTTLGRAGIGANDLTTLASEAAEQWTGRFNPRPFGFEGALEIYQAAW
jgi:alcohol dehydrogenase